MSQWLAEWIPNIMNQLGYWGIGLLMFLENLFPKLDWVLGGSRNSYLKLDLRLKWKSFAGYS